MDQEAQKAVRKYLSVIKRAVSLIEGMLDNDDGGLLEQMVSEDSVHSVQSIQPAAQVTATPEPEPEPEVQPARTNLAQPQQPLAEQAKSAEDYDDWKIARTRHINDLMAIDVWPEAVAGNLIASPSREDQINRARAVMDMMVDRPIENANFLDFGCGEGWIAEQAMERGVSSSVGYDIKLHENWKDMEHAEFTHIFNELKRNHFDVVFLYDVMDHTQNPEEVMKQVRNLLKKDGVVYLRCHPWCSPHATHVYKQNINRAFIHLFLNQDELRELSGESPMFTRSELKPFDAYHWWFREFDIVKERVIKHDVNHFFHVPAFKELLRNEQRLDEHDIDVEDFLNLMQVHFVDYVLTPKE